MIKYFISLLIVSVLLLGSKSNGQVFIGGGLTLKGKNSNNANISGLGFSLSPEIGYTFNDRLSVGCNLKYVYRLPPYDNSDDWCEGSSLSVFGRVVIMRYNSLAINIQTSLGMGIGYVNDGSNINGMNPYGGYGYTSYRLSINPNLGQYNFIGAHLNPQISYALGSKLIFIAKLGDLNYSKILGLTSGNNQNSDLLNYNISIFDLACVIKL